MSIDGDPVNIKPKDTIGGTITGNVYVTKRKKDHVMQKFGGSFGVSYDVLHRLEWSKVKYILFLYFGPREKCQYIASVDHFINNPDATYTDTSEGMEDLQHHVRLINMIKVPGVEGWRTTVGKLNSES
jgi:hypothetical protein